MCLRRKACLSSVTIIATLGVFSLGCSDDTTPPTDSAIGDSKSTKPDSKMAQDSTPAKPDSKCVSTTKTVHNDSQTLFKVIPLSKCQTGADPCCSDSNRKEPGTLLTITVDESTYTAGQTTTASTLTLEVAYYGLSAGLDATVKATFKYKGGTTETKKETFKDPKHSTCDEPTGSYRTLTFTHSATDNLTKVEIDVQPGDYGVKVQKIKLVLGLGC